MFAALSLGVETEFLAFPQKGPLGAGHEQGGHQVFEHGARPAGQTPVAVLLQQRPAEPPPVLQRDLAPGQGQIAGEHGLACQQVVPAPGAPLLLRVVGDEKEAPAAVEEEGEVHLLDQRG